MSKKKQSGSKYDFSSTDLLLYIWDKRIPLILVSFIAAVASIIVSFTITPKFRSTVVMYPTTSASISKNLLADNYGGRTTLYEIGEEEKSEQLIQILNSDEIRDRIIEKYNLFEHYGIDSTSKFPLTQIYAEYNSNIKFRITEYLSVVIDVLDKDPQFAADLANDISSLVDTVYNNMYKQRAIDALQLVEKECIHLSENLEILQDSMQSIRALGINVYESQSERLYEGLAQAINEGNNSAQRIIENKLDNLSKYSGAYISIRDQIGMESSRLNRMQQRYREAKLEADQSLPHKFVVSSAEVSEKKAYPKKSIIVIITVLVTFLLTLMTLIYTENIKRKV